MLSSIITSSLNILIAYGTNAAPSFKSIALAEQAEDIEEEQAGSSNRKPKQQARSQKIGYDQIQNQINDIQLKSKKVEQSIRALETAGTDQAVMVIEAKDQAPTGIYSENPQSLSESKMLVEQISKRDADVQK